MDNKKKILNEGEGEISLALIGLILKKIKKVAFEVVYEKLLKDGDKKASNFFKEDGVAENFKIQNYEDLLNLKEIGEKPSAKPIGMKPDTVQIKKLTSEQHDVGKEAVKRLDKLVKSDEKDKNAFDKVKGFLQSLFGFQDEEEDEPLLAEQEEEQTDEDEAKKTLKKLIYKYDPLKNIHNTHIFPFTELETYFIKKRTGLEKTYNIEEITTTITRAAIAFHELKKIRLTILKVQKASRALQGQKIKDDEEVKTIGDLMKNLQEDQELKQLNDDEQTDNLIKSFVAGKGKIGLNPFAIADELLYSVYGEDKIKTFMRKAEELHDELNEISKYVVTVLKSRKLDSSGDDQDEEGEDLKAAEGEQAIKNALELYTNKINKKYKYKKDGEEKSVSPQIINVLKVLADAIVKSFPKEEIAGSEQDGENSVTEIFSRSDNNFDKFAKKVGDRINNLKLPGKIADERSIWTRIKDFFKGKRNIDSILRNAYEKGGIKDDDKKVFEEILKTDKYIGEDEIQYMVMRILLKMKEPKETSVEPERTEEPLDQEDNIPTDSEYELPITVDFPKHIENVENILGSFLKDFAGLGTPPNSDTERDVLVLPITYLKDKAGYDYNPESSRAKRELLGKMFIYLYEQLNYFRDREEDREELKTEFTSKFEEHFQGKKNSLESIMLSYKLANDFKFLNKVNNMQEGYIKIIEEGNRFKFLKDDLLRMLISQNIPAKINTKDFSDEEAEQAIKVEKTLEALLQKTFDNLYSDSLEENLAENRLFGVENTFKEKLAVKLYSILYSNKKYRAAYKIPDDDENKAIKKITKAIDSSYNSTDIDDDDRELLMKFYKLQWRKFFKPNLYGRTISSLARYYLKNVEQTHKGPTPITTKMWESIKIIVEEKTYYLSDVRENTSADEYKFRSVIESKYEAVTFDFSPETIKEIARAFERTEEGKFSVNSSETQEIEFYKDKSEGKNYIYILEARKYLLDNKEKFQGTVEGETTHGIKEITNVSDKIEIKLANNESYKLNSEQWSSLIEALENDESYNTEVDNEDLEIERKADQEEEETNITVSHKPDDFVVVYTGRDGDKWAEFVDQDSEGQKDNTYTIEFPNMMRMEGETFDEWENKNQFRNLIASFDTSVINDKDLDKINNKVFITKLNPSEDHDDSITEYELFYDPKGQLVDEYRKIFDNRKKDKFIKEAREKIKEKYLDKFRAVVGKKSQGIEIRAMSIVYRDGNDFKNLGAGFQEPAGLIGDPTNSFFGINDNRLNKNMIVKNDEEAQTAKILVAWATRGKQEGENQEVDKQLMSTPKWFNKKYIGSFESERRVTEEKLAKLIKPLIREKLKRKQNGKKNLRN